MHLHRHINEYMLMLSRKIYFMRVKSEGSGLKTIIRTLEYIMSCAPTDILYFLFNIQGFMCSTHILQVHKYYSVLPMIFNLRDQANTDTITI